MKHSSETIVTRIGVKYRENADFHAKETSLVGYDVDGVCANH
jgi:hypothetical protein